MGGVSSIQVFLLDFLNFFNFAKPITRVVPCQHGFMYGCKQWSNDINESNWITI